MNNEFEDNDILHGRVKWFDPAKGIGFVEPDSGGPDVLLHGNVLRNFGQSAVSDGSGIEVRIQRSARGLQVVEVLAIEPPINDVAALDEFVDMDLSVLASLPLEPARMKWFDAGKGFGFANAFGKDEDIFVHIEVLRRFGLLDLQPGEAVCLRVVDGERGKMAAQVLTWNASVESEALRRASNRQ